MLRLLLKGFKLDLYFMGLVALIALQSGIEHHLIELSYNYFLLAAFADIAAFRFHPRKHQRTAP